MQRSGSDLIIRNKTNSDQVTIKGALENGNGYNYLQNIEFADGTVWNRETIREQLRHINGTKGDDILTGQENGYNYNNSEVIDGGAGNDTIYGGYGNDTITGGTGNDTLVGGNGADTYLFNLGDGQDVIDNYDPGNWQNDRLVFGEGITPEDIRLTRSGNDLQIHNRKRAGDCVTIKNAYLNDYYFVGTIEFSDGTVWNHSDTKKIAGLGSADTIYGGISDNIYDHDFTQPQGIYDMGGNDVINLGAGMLDIVFEQSGNDLIISDSMEKGSLTIHDWYSSDHHKIETMYSEDGYSIIDRQVQLLIDSMASFTGENGIAAGERMAMNTEESRQFVSQFWQRQE